MLSAASEVIGQSGDYDVKQFMILHPKMILHYLVCKLLHPGAHATNTSSSTTFNCYTQRHRAGLLELLFLFPNLN